jgi:manganese-dependent inorganic pyrophosphatase
LEEAEDKLIFKALSPRLFSLPGILSRKKQLFPEVYRVLEEMDREGRG